MNHTLSLGYDQTRSTTRNRGLDGLDLPERSYDSTSSQDAAKLSLTSVGKAVTKLRIRYTRSGSTRGAQLSAPALFVLDAFHGGGNQGSLFLRESVDELEFTDVLTWGYKTHTIKAGVEVNTIRIDNDERSNFGGSFTFGTGLERDAAGDVVVDATGAPVVIAPIERYRRTLEGLPGYGPSQFSINRGNPLVGLTERRMAWFVQDDWRLSSRVTLSYGLRHDFQSGLSDDWTLGPRLALAFIPDDAEMSTVRIGTGVFTEPVSTDVTFDTIRFDQAHQQQFIVSDPTFFLEIPTDVSGELVPPSATYVKAPDLRAARYVVSNLSYERKLPKGLAASIGYVRRQGRHLLRLRNINAPLTLGTDELPHPDRGPILQFESTGRSIRHEVQFSLRANIGEDASSYLRYTLGSTRTDTDGPYTAPANSYDLSTEQGPAFDDVRHQVVAGGSLSLPGGWSVNPYVIATSAVPFNITTGFDNNGDTLFTDRPAFAQEGDPNAILTPFGLLTPRPQPGDSPIPRNLGRERRLFNVSLNVSKSFPVSLLYGSISFSVDIQNLLNHALLTGYNGVLVSPVFGEPYSGLDGRRVDLSLKFAF